MAQAAQGEDAVREEDGGALLLQHPDPTGSLTSSQRAQGEQDIPKNNKKNPCGIKIK